MGSRITLIWDSLRILVSRVINGPNAIKVRSDEPLSRTAWKFDEADQNIDSLRRQGTIGEDGYINVASQFGLSGERGMSPSLYSPLTAWVPLGGCAGC